MALLRVVAGRANQSVDRDTVTQGFNKGLISDIDFKGFGVKLSADASHPVTAASRLRLIEGASVAPMSGDNTYSTVNKLGSDSETVNGDLMMSSVGNPLIFNGVHS